MDRFLGGVVSLFAWLFDAAAAILSVAAGAYLLSYNSQPITALGGDSGKSWFDIIAHGIGIYFIGKGIYMFRTARMARAQLELERESHR